MAILKSLERERAKFAYDKACEGKNKKDGAVPKEYKSYCNSIPMMIKTNGLGNTLAFMKSKKKTYNLIYNQIEEWLKEKSYNIENDLGYYIITRDSTEYRRITLEVLTLFSWLRRFATGLIGEEENDKNRNN